MGDDDRAALLTALTTEHFVLQGASTATIGESGARSTLYASALSSALGAIGFASAHPAVLVVFVATVLPVVFLLGVFTTARLVDTTVENVGYQRRIEAIRAYSRTLHADAARYLPAGSLEEIRRTRTDRRSGVLRTIGTSVIVVNGAVAGATVDLLLLLAAHAPVGAALAAGVVAGLLALGAGLLYQDRRIRPALLVRGADDEAGAGLPER